MMKKKLAVVMCAVGLTMGLAACGGTDTKSTPEAQTESTQKTASGKEDQKEEQTLTGATFELPLLYDDADELIEYVPFAPVGSSYAEAMMQVSGYTYTFIPDGTEYTMNVECECGTPGEDTSMYLKRTYEFKGTCTAEGDVYTLNAPEHCTMKQESAGQFAASSGEGGADYWGPNGLEIDETFANEEGYAGVSTGEKILTSFQPCTATVDGDSVSFAALTE